MTREIQILNRYGCYETRTFIFPGGELQVRIPDLPTLYEETTIVARLQSSDDVMRLVLTTDILDRNLRGRRRLVVPYFPYARQDRVMQVGEAFSLKAVARLINSLGYDEVVVCDPHSDVTPAVLENVRVITQLELVQAHEMLRRLLNDRMPIVIAPDAGAAKKAYSVARQFDCEILTARKVRDVGTGAITSTHLDDQTGSVMGRECLIVDDICDGGRTFIELAKVLREQGASQVYLYVTHGIFSKGFGVFRGILDGIYFTDSFIPDHVLDDRHVPAFILPMSQKGLIHAS